MRAVLFDLDGTLIDSLGDIASALDHVLGELGLPQPTLDEYRSLVGYGAQLRGRSPGSATRGRAGS